MASTTFTTELTVDRMVHGGNGLARLDDGRIALVTGAIPGERVNAELSTRKGVLLGTVIEVVTPSSDRVATPLHPGLDYGHIAYTKQLDLKREVVADALTRALKRDLEVPAVRPAPQLLGYRNAVQPAVGGNGLGYRRPGTGQVVVLDADPTAQASVNAAWAALLQVEAPRHYGLREVVIRGNDGGEALVALIGTGKAHASLDLGHRLVAAGVAGVTFAPFDPRGRFRGGSERLAGARWLTQRYGDVELTIGATAFAQPNPGAAGLLYRELVAWAGVGEHALELFAGGGAIAMHLAPHFREVTAVEVDRAAIDRGRRDADRLGIGNVTFTRGDAKDVQLPDSLDLIVVDPPRAGLAAELRDTLATGLVAAAGNQRQAGLLYVSCDVATWARDVADFEARGLELVKFEPFDFYPYTHHIEILSLLTPSGI